MAASEDFKVISDEKQNVFQARVRAFLKEGNKITGRGFSMKGEKFVAVFFFEPKEAGN